MLVCNSCLLSLMSVDTSKCNYSAVNDNINREFGVVLQRWLAHDWLSHWASRFGQIVKFYLYFLFNFQTKQKQIQNSYVCVRRNWKDWLNVSPFFAVVSCDEQWWLMTMTPNSNNFAADAQSICIELCRRTLNKFWLSDNRHRWQLEINIFICYSLRKK